VTTAGSDFRNSLAAYTGAAVNGLTLAAGSLGAAGTTATQIQIAVVGGVTYHFAVDGFSGASGTARLALSLSGSPPLLGEAVRGGDGRFRFTIAGSPDQVLNIDSADDLGSWNFLTTVTNTTGTLEFIDPTPATLPRRFYRGIVP
jgi:hypothetical protein